MPMSADGDLPPDGRIAQGLQVTVATAGDAVEVALDGYLDMSTIAMLRAAVEDLPRPGVALLVDLAELSFIDSTGLNFLVSLQRRSGREGFTLALRPGNRGVTRTFEIARLDAAFLWTGDLPAADG